jgi:AraC-like DNA-binding protein
VLLACDRLENVGDPISAVATALGYESESAFSTAFKRVMRCSPRQYCRNLAPRKFLGGETAMSSDIRADPRGLVDSAATI